MMSEHFSNGLHGYVSFKDPATSEKVMEVARNELGETEELKKECLEQMKTLIRNEGVRCITRDDFLLRFLRTKKFNVQASFKVLRNYALKRAKIHDLLLNMRPEVLESCLNLKTFGFLPYRDSHERLVFLGQTGAWDMDACSFEELVMVFILFLNYAAESESSQTIGTTAIWDHKTIVWKHLPHFVRNAKFAASLAFECIPIRYQKVHFINENPLLQLLLQLLYPFLPTKIKERIISHGNRREILFEHFSPSILPSDFGGSLGPLSTDHLRESMLDYLQKMKDEQRYFL